ncbi:alpha/beta hydrolase [Halosquirtibacter laminarini]|uniref:Alpha/beta hydrolase n=1 Tax=Halosquirtibacter laminarini TaxID=3374600 RepID=A0AC61NQS4_9BACT|nr:alpha/beta hydrolase [Prolixibacteraceae bacterium]
MNNLYSFLIILFISVSLHAQVIKNYKEVDVTFPSKNIKLNGSLMTPLDQSSNTAVLIISGSGPTDRNGNSTYSQTNNLLQIAQFLALHNIASLRYDKRAIQRNNYLISEEQNLRFGQFTKDAEAAIQFLKKKKFKEIFVIGHSQGALIASVAVQKEKVDGLVTLCGAGKTGDQIIEEQINAIPQKEFTNQAIPILKILREGKQTQDVPITLRSLFRPSVQPFLISWFAVDPIEEIHNVKCPILIVAGKQDVQIPIGDSELLYKASKKRSKLVILNNMNHVLKDVGPDLKKNRASYNDPNKPISKELVNEILKFIHSNK